MGRIFENSKVKAAVHVVSMMICAVLLSVSVYAADNGFSCYVIDQQSCIINSYYAEEDQIYYLFLTSNVNIPSMDVHLQENIVASSAGAIDPDTHILSGAFSASGDTVTLTTADSKEITLTVMQSDLPSLYISLNGTTLDEIHADKNVKYPGNHVFLTDSTNSKNKIINQTAEIKGRGNTSWAGYDKKGYQIKFDKKTSVLGMDKAKKWVLLANASDDSMLRNKMIFDLASNISEIASPKGEYVDLWIDGDYRGLYLITEKVENNRCGVALTDDYGALFEQDNAYYRDEDYWFQAEISENYYTVKEYVQEDEDHVRGAMSEFSDSLYAFEQYLATEDLQAITLDDLSTMIDVDSFAAYYLINEYALNHDSIISSFFWYKNGANDVIHLGPIWDFDTYMGNDIGGAGYDSYYVYGSLVFSRLLQCPAFENELDKLYTHYYDLFAELPDCADSLASYVSDSANMNYTRWDSLGKSSPKTVFAKSYSEAVTNVQNWLSERQTHFDIDSTLNVVANVSADCCTMTITLRDAGNYANVWVPTWSSVNGQDDLVWYQATKNADSTWSYTVDLTKHQSVGIYYVHAYGGNGRVETMIAATVTYVEKLAVPTVTTEVSEDCSTMTITLRNADDYANVWFPTWSEENGQDDLVWYQATKNADGTWSCTVDLTKHQSVGIYNVHVYGGNGRVETGIGTTTAYVEKLADLQ